MKHFLPLLFLFVFSARAADVVIPPTLSVDTTATPPKLTITLTIDATAAITAQQQAVADTTKANADARGKDPNAPQKDVAGAGRAAFVKAIIPTLYKLVENTERGANLSDAEVAAQAAEAKAKADAAAAALIALRPTITTK